MLQNEAPEDEELGRALMEAKEQLKKQKGLDAAAWRSRPSSVT